MKSAFTVLVLAVGLATQSAAADIFEPFTTANMNPFTRLHGVPQTRSAHLTTAGKLEVGLQLDVANNFTDSLSGNERIRLDGETHRTNLSLRYGLSERWELSIDLPYIRHSGGSLDGFIENWHSWFGLPNGGREDSAEDELTYFWRHGTQTRASLTRSESGMGDITVYAGYRLGGDDERQWTVRAGASLPTGDADSLTGSGGTDVFASLHVSQASLWRSEKLRFHGSIGAALLDDTDIIGATIEDWIVFGSGSLAWQVHDRVSLKTQLDFNTAAYDSDLKELGDFSTQLTLGGSLLLGSATRLDIGVTEDIITDTSPDVVFHLALRRHF